MSTARRTKALRWCGDRRRLALEVLEQRLLLTLSPATISDPLEQECLLDGLAGLKDWAHTLDDYGLAAQLLPAADRSLGQAIDWGDVLQRGLVAPVTAYFDNVTGNPTTDGVLSTLQNLGPVGDLTITVAPGVTGGLDSGPGYSEYVFNLVFQAGRSVASGISLGPRGDELGFSFDSSATGVTLSAATTFNFSFGMDLASGLDPKDAFFIRVAGLSASADASGSFSAGSTRPMNVGFYDGELVSGSVSLDADLAVTLSDPAPDLRGNITLSELEDTDLSSLVALAGSGSAGGDLWITAGSFGGFTPTGSPHVTFSSTSNPFVAPDLSFNTDFDELLSFTRMNNFTLLGVVDQLGTWLDQLRTSSVLDASTHLARDTTLGDALDLSSLITDSVNGLIARLVNNGVPTFDSAQTLVTALGSALQLPPVYNATTNELTYHVQVDRAFADSTRTFGTDLDLSPLGSLTSSSTVDVSADGTLEFTLGVDLSPLQAQLVATAAGPANGRLSADAVFTLSIGDASPVTVTVPQAATAGNASLDDLVADFNAALAAAGLGTSVVAARDGNRLKLATPGSGLLVALKAQASNPIVTEVWFRSEQMAADPIYRHVFLKDASILGNASLTASDIDASADLGFLEAAVVGGFGGATITTSLELKSPGASVPGGKVYLDELFKWLSSDITQIVATPQVTGDLILDLPLEVTCDVLGGPQPARADLNVIWTDLSDPDTFDLSFDDPDGLLDFSHLNSATIADAMHGLGEYLGSVEGLELLSQRVPGLDRSIGQMAAFAGRFEELAANLEQAPARVLQELETRIEEAFGLSGSAVQLSLAEGDTVLRIDVTVGRTVAEQFPIDLDLEGLGFGDFGHLVDFKGTGAVTAEAGAVFDLDLGIDLSDPDNPLPFVYDSSDLTFSAKAAGTDIAFSTAIGPLGAWIKQGSILVDLDGNPATSDAAALAVTLEDNNADHRIYLGGPDRLSTSHARVSLDGQVHVVLPVYFPTPSHPLGNIELTVTDLGDLAHTTTLNAPDLESAFEEIDLPNNLGVIVDGIDYVLERVEAALDSNVLHKNLPMIGDQLSDAADFIEDIRNGVILELQNRFDEALHCTSVVVQTALFDALGHDGLNILANNPDGGPNPNVTLDDVVVVMTDTDGNGQSDQIDIDFVLGKSYTLVDKPIKFDVGIPALGLDVDGNVQLELGFEWDVHLGVDSHDFYFDTSPGAELTVYLRAGIPEMHAQGNLWFFQLDVTDDATEPSALALAVVVDLLDPVDSGDHKLTFGDLTNGDWGLGQLLDVSIVGGATINLDLVLSYEGDARFPTIQADFLLDWPFLSGDLGGDPPTVAFNNVRLNVGEFVSDFAAPILKRVQKFTEPLQPIVDFLEAPMPVLKDLGLNLTPLDIARIWGYGDIADYVDAIADIIDVVNHIPVINGEIYVSLGSFDLGGTDPRGEADLTGATPRVTDEVHPETQLPGGAAGFYDSLHELGISLPILESPMAIFQLLMGHLVDPVSKSAIDLFHYDLPELSLSFPFPIIKIGPIVPPYPIFIAFSGLIEAGIDLSFGFDTHGFAKYQETHDWWDVFSGLYIDDRNDAGTDGPEAWLKGTINGGVEVNLAIASAGISAGVTLSVYANLSDTDGDGKIYVDEFLANLDLGLLTTFDVSGDIWLHLDAYIEVLFRRVWSKQLAAQKLADFKLTQPENDKIYVDRFHGNEQQGTATYVGVGPGLHVDGLSLEATGDVDWYRFDLIRPDSIDVDVRFSDSRGNVDLAVYDASGHLLGQSTTENDREVVSLVNLPVGTYYARVSGSAQNNYLFAVEPGSTSSTRVIYVAPEEQPGEPTDFNKCYYTTEPGNDDNDGLSCRKPKATLQGVLDTTDLGPNDLVVFDTGSYPSGATIGAGDEGATYVGSKGGAVISGVTIDDSDNSRFYNLQFSEGGTGLTIAGDGANDAAGNLIHHCTFGGNMVGLRIDSAAPNLIENNTFAGNTWEGIHVSPGATSTVRLSPVSGSATGIYCDSKVAEIYGNWIHDNTVGMSSLQGVLGPDNPPPFGAPAGHAPNEIYNNDTGVLIPAGASGVVVRFNSIHNNSLGIEQLGDNSLIIANDVYENTAGIRGTGVLGPADWSGQLYNLIRDNDVGVWALPGAELRFNRIYGNTTGVYVGDDPGDPIVHHNLIYGNTAQGVLVDGASDVQIVNNTIYAPVGNGVELQGFVSDIDVLNNVIWTASGCALYVAAESQFGYQSDYNNLYTGGTGRIAFQGKDFDDLYDWQVEAESDLHSIGYTTVDPTLDDPQFVNPGAGNFHLQTGSTSIDAGDPTSSFALEPSPNGNRIDLGAYGNTPEAGVSAAYWLRITDPCFYVDLVPSRTYSICWETYNIPNTVGLDIDLILEDFGKVADISASPIPVTAGSTTWTPGSFVAGNRTNHYRIQVTTVGAVALVESSREAFSIPNVAPSDYTTFYVDDRDLTNSGDEYTPGAAGDNRNTGTSPLDPKVVIRPLVLSYEIGPFDTVLVDTGEYVHAVNLNLSADPIPFDPRMNRFTGSSIRGPTSTGNVARIDRANPFAGSVAIDMINVDNTAMSNLTIVGAEIGVHVRNGSTYFDAWYVTFSHHSLDGIRVEGASDWSIFWYCTFSDNGRHGIFVDSLLTWITDSEAYNNGKIGMALRSVGATFVVHSKAYNNETGIDIINPGTGQAVIGDSDLLNSMGNLVYGNRQDGVFASGNVLVAGNTVYANGNTGIRLDDGADAVRNVVHTHTTGISALGSTSDILDNRVYDDSDTGIIASFASNVQRNVVYTNGQYGIHVDRFSGLIDHNLVYETGNTSIWVEGAGAGAQLINNTVYEPCTENTPTEEQTVVTCAVQWMISLEEFDPPMACGGMLFEGTAQIKYDAPRLWNNPTSGDTFKLGPGGGWNAETEEPVPADGEDWWIPTDIVALDLRSVDETPWGPIEVHLSPLDVTWGGIVVKNEGGYLSGYNYFKVFVSIYLVEPRITLFSQEKMEFWQTIPFDPLNPDTQFNEYEVLQVPLEQMEAGPRVKVDMNPPSEPPDGACQVYGWHAPGYPVPEQPQDRGRYCAEIGIHVSNNSSHALLRNNAVYVEGCRCETGPTSHDIVVEADSTGGWRSDFNLFTTKHGLIGQWAGTDTPTLRSWQLASKDDAFSIDPPVETIWVDPDGADDRLGYRGPSEAGDGRDDNFHLRSPFGQAMQGALAPVEDFSPLSTQLPVMQTILWQVEATPNERDLSPGVDWGDPSYDYSAELLENGKLVNLGCYGNTDQASRSEPEYVHLVYPLGWEQLVESRQCWLQWRSHDNAGWVAIELHQGSAGGPLILTIQPNWPNTGAYRWTVPSGLAPASNYVIVVKRQPTLKIVGATRRQFSISPIDTVAPRVTAVTPQIVDYELSTNDAAIAPITLDFKEELDSGQANDPTGYELRSAGSNGVFDDGDDVLWDLVPNYRRPPAGLGTWKVDLAPAIAPLSPGEYRLKVFSGTIVDVAGNALDGDGDGTVGGDYVRRFAIDWTPPTVFINSVGPSPRNGSVPSITIVFDEAVRGLGLADVRLTRNGGSNLLSDYNTLTSSDGITWTLPNLAGLTEEPGSYLLQLTAANLCIRDLAGNPLGMAASTNWSTDTISPTVQVQAVQPDPRNQTLAQITFTFSEPVDGFDLGDLVLLRDEGANLLPGSATLTVDHVTWTLGNLTGLTGANGTYTLSLDAVLSGITDRVGNPLAAGAVEIWQTDLSPPQVDIVDVAPDPRHTPVDQITIAFTEPVTGLDLADLTLTRDGGGNLLTGGQTLASVDGLNWTLGNLTGLSGQAGQYVLSLTAAGSGIRDFAGNVLTLDAGDTWLVDTTPPTADIVDVSPDPHSAAVDAVAMEFDEPVTGLELSDLSLTRGTSSVPLSGVATLATSDGITWTLGNLSSLTAADGTYHLTLTAAGSQVRDAAGNPMAGDAAESWLMDGTPPSVDIVDVTPDPRTTAVSQIDIVFTEPVDGFDRGDLVLLRDEGANLLPGSSATLTTEDHVTWTLGNLTGLTGAPGAYALLLAAPGSQIVDRAGNPLPHGTTETWLYPRPPAHVAGRHIFYNRCYFDGYDSGASEADDRAVATDKVALLPGVKATFANFSTFTRGLNGIMVDIADLPNQGSNPLNIANDFRFKIGNDNNPFGNGWSTATAPTILSVRAGKGDNGSDRVTLIWNDNAIPTRRWLQVTVKATAATGLTADDVFYFGSSIGDVNGNGVAAFNDMSAIYQKVNKLIPTVASPYDINRDHVINFADMSATYQQVNRTPYMQLITPAAAPPPCAAGRLSGATGRLSASAAAVTARSGGTGSLSASVAAVTACDAVMQQVGGQGTFAATPASAILSWLYDFDVPSRNTSPTKKEKLQGSPVDLLLASCV